MPSAIALATARQGDAPGRGGRRGHRTTRRTRRSRSVPRYACGEGTGPEIATHASVTAGDRGVLRRQKIRRVDAGRHCGSTPHQPHTRAGPHRSAAKQPGTCRRLHHEPPGIRTAPEVQQHLFAMALEEPLEPYPCLGVASHLAPFSQPQSVYGRLPILLTEMPRNRDAGTFTSQREEATTRTRSPAPNTPVWPQHSDGEPAQHGTYRAPEKRFRCGWTAVSTTECRCGEVESVDLRLA